MGDIPVSVVVMTRNEAANLPACLASLRRFNECFVVDSSSTDGTRAVAERHGARLVPFQWSGAYPKKKQWCLETLPFRHEWVFFIDADERVSDDLADEVAHVLAGRPPQAGFFVTGRYRFLGHNLRFGPRTHKLALLRKGRARFHPVPDLDVTTMWEVEGHYQPELDGPAGRLRGALRHADTRSPYAWFDRHNRYSDWEAALWVTGGFKAVDDHERPTRRWLKRLFRSLPARPLMVFFLDYIIRLGALDGIAGLHLCIARAFYYWQIDMKVHWLRYGKTDQG